MTYGKTDGGTASQELIHSVWMDVGAVKGGRGRMAIAALVLTTTMLASAASAAIQGGPAAEADVRFEFAGTQVRYIITVKNTGSQGAIVSVFIGRDRGLVQRPFGIGKPRGWGARVVKQQLPGGSSRWQLWLSCDPITLEPATDAEAGEATADPHRGAQVAAHAIQPGQTGTFTLALQNRRSVEIERESVQIMFAGGQILSGGE